MEKRQIAIYKGNKHIEIKNEKIPKLKKNEILIRIVVSGICGTDVKTYMRGHPAFKPPVILGHEFSGIVDEVGIDVKSCQVGDKVTVAPYIECGQCYFCKNGDYTLCENKKFMNSGAFAQYIIVNDNYAHEAMIKIDNNIDFDVASLTEPIACCFNAIEQIKVEKDEVIMIIGAGVMGILNGFICKEKGAKKIFITDNNSERLSIAKTLGLDTINIDYEDPLKKINNITNNYKCDKVIVAVGDCDAIEEGFNYIRKGGKIHIFGGPPKDSYLSILSYDIHYKRITLIGSSGYSKKNFVTSYNFIKKNVSDLKKLITDRYRLKNIEKALNNVAKGKGLKSIIQFE